MARRTAIGLDIGTSVVRAAELSFGRGGTTLDRFGQVVLPEGAVRDGEVVDEAAVTSALRHLWSATGFTHKRVVLGVANQRVIVRQMDLPWMEQAELRRSLAFHVADFLPIAVEQSVLDFFPLEEVADDNGARMLRGLLVAAQRDTVLSNVRCAENAGLKVTSVDLTSFAVLRAMGRQTDLTVGTEALIDIGARVTNIVVHSAGVPRFVRILLMGGQDVTDAVSEQLGVPLAQAEGMKQHFATYGTGEELAMVSRTVATTAQDFVDEIRGSLDYYASSNPGPQVERIVVSGGGSRLEGLIDRLASSTRLPVISGDPLRPLRIGKTGLDQDQLAFIKPLAAVPVGLALGDLMTVQLTKEFTGTELAPEPGPPAPTRIPWAPVAKVNLLPIEIIENRRFRSTQLILGSAVIFALVLAGAGTFWAQQGVDKANSQLVASQARVSTLEGEQARYAAVPQVVAQVEAATVARTMAMGADVLWYRYLNELDSARPAGIKLSGITVAMNTTGTAGTAANPLAPSGVGTLVLGGTAVQYSDVSSWLESLNKLTGISSSALTSAAKAEGGVVSFSSTVVVDSDALSGRYNKKAG